MTSAQTGQEQNILKGFVPKMKSGSHVFISRRVKVSSGSPGSGVSPYHADSIKPLLVVSYRSYYRD